MGFVVSHSDGKFRAIEGLSLHFPFEFQVLHDRAPTKPNHTMDLIVRQASAHPRLECADRDPQEFAGFLLVDQLVQNIGLFGRQNGRAARVLERLLHRLGNEPAKVLFKV
jgi:hypothetical protein